MRALRINWGSIGELALGSLSRLSIYWPFSWRGLSAIILGVLLAKWFWILFAPHAIYTAATPDRTSAGVEAGQLFGATDVTEEVSQGVALPNVQLLGVFAASGGKPGFAILKLDSRQLGVAGGEEVAKGTKLIEVHADHVILERAGVQQRVSLENKYAGSAGSPQITSLPSAQGAESGKNKIKGIPPARGADMNSMQKNYAPRGPLPNRPGMPHR